MQLVLQRLLKSTDVEKIQKLKSRIQKSGHRLTRGDQDGLLVAFEDVLKVIAPALNSLCVSALSPSEQSSQDVPLATGVTGLLRCYLELEGHVDNGWTLSKMLHSSCALNALFKCVGVFTQYDEVKVVVEALNALFKGPYPPPIHVTNHLRDRLQSLDWQPMLEVMFEGEPCWTDRVNVAYVEDADTLYNNGGRDVEITMLSGKKLKLKRGQQYCLPRLKPQIFQTAFLLGNEETCSSLLSLLLALPVSRGRRMFMVCSLLDMIDKLVELGSESELPELLRKLRDCVRKLPKGFNAEECIKLLHRCASTDHVHLIESLVGIAAESYEKCDENGRYEILSSLLQSLPPYQDSSPRMVTAFLVFISFVLESGKTCAKIDFAGIWRFVLANSIGHYEKGFEIERSSYPTLENRDSLIDLIPLLASVDPIGTITMSVLFLPNIEAQNVYFILAKSLLSALECTTWKEWLGSLNEEEKKKCKKQKN